MSRMVGLRGGSFALIDDDDYERVSGRSWRLRWDKRADAHIGGKPLDNRKQNLRLVEPHSNTLNQVGKPNQRVCKYKGVSLKNGMFAANIDNSRLLGHLHIGAFVTQREAGIAYDIFAKKLHGEYARLNVPEATAIEIANVQAIIDDPKANMRHATSRYIGVGWNKIHKRWRARIGQRQVGTFETEKEAALAYNKEAIKCGRILNNVS